MVYFSFTPFCRNTYTSEDQMWFDVIHVKTSIKSYEYILGFTFYNEALAGVHRCTCRAPSGKIKFVANIGAKLKNFPCTN